MSLARCVIPGPSSSIGGVHFAKARYPTRATLRRRAGVVRPQARSDSSSDVDSATSPVWRRASSAVLGGVLVAMAGQFAVIEPGYADSEGADLGSALSDKKSAAVRRREMLSSIRERALEQASAVEEKSGPPEDEADSGDRKNDLFSDFSKSSLEMYEELSSTAPKINIPEPTRGGGAFGGFFGGGGKKEKAVEESEEGKEASEDEVSAPKFSAPKLSIPKIEAPKLDMPPMPSFGGSSTEEESAQESEAPKFTMPKAPKLDAPELPKLEAPKIDVPPMPKFSPPELPKFEAPKLPGASESTEAGDEPVSKGLPKFEVPKFEAPKFSFQLPSKEPAKEAPKEPSKEEAPTPESSEKEEAPAPTPAPPPSLPKFQAPSIPKFEAPKFDVPKFEVPKFEAPKSEAPKSEPTEPKTEESKAEESKPKPSGDEESVVDMLKKFTEPTPEPAKPPVVVAPTPPPEEKPYVPEVKPYTPRSAAPVLPAKPEKAEEKKVEEQKAEAKKVEEKKEDKKSTKKKGPLPMWAAQILLLMFYSGIIAIFSVFYDSTKGPITKVFSWVDKALEKLSVPSQD